MRDRFTNNPPGQLDDDSDDEIEKDIENMLREDDIDDNNLLDILFDESQIYESLLEKLVLDLRKKLGTKYCS